MGMEAGIEMEMQKEKESGERQDGWMSMNLYLKQSGDSPSGLQESVVDMGSLFSGHPNKRTEWNQEEGSSKKLGHPTVELMQITTQRGQSALAEIRAAADQIIARSNDGSTPLIIKEQGTKGGRGL
eukprot:766543-Hanusia_phi.AAC.5